MPALRINGVTDEALHIQWNDGCVGIGRHASNQIRLDDARVSAWHAAVYEDGSGGYRVRDLGSRSGVRIGGRKLASQILVDGLTFEVGPYHLTYNDGSAPDELPVSLSDDVVVGESGVSTVSRPLPDAGEPKGSTAYVRRLLQSMNTIALAQDLGSSADGLIDEIFNDAKPSVCLVATVKGDISAPIAYRFNRIPTARKGEVVECSMSVVRKAIDSGQTYTVQETKHDPALRDARSIKQLSIIGSVCVPLARDANDHCVLYADWREPEPGPSREELLWIRDLGAGASPAIENGLKQQRRQKQHEGLRRQVYSPKPLIGISQAMRTLLAEADRCAPFGVHVLLFGETGTGKELLARRIHEKSGRQGAFVEVNCGAIPETLIGSTLFGHEKGAFTDAQETKEGVFEQADHGTLFLDEIGEMPLSQQVALLRVMETQTVTRLGGSALRPVDVRIIAATNRDLADDSSRDLFRSDLLHRLQFKLPTPPLRVRPEDIPILTFALLDQLNRQHHKHVEALAPKVLARFHEYSWPGNIRELQNALLCAYVLCNGRIELSDLSKTPEVMGDNDVTFETLREHERRYLVQVLTATRGQVKKTAEILGVTPEGLAKKMKRFDLDKKHFK